MKNVPPSYHQRFSFLIVSIILAILLLSLGFLVALLIDANRALNIESPFTTQVQSARNAPPDVLAPSEIEVYEDKVIIRLAGISLSSYAPTGSMEPILGEHANGLRIVPQSASEISVGDIVSFEHAGLLVVHRVIEEGVDDKGVYFITQGDAAQVNDGKIRFSQIRYKTIGILY